MVAAQLVVEGDNEELALTLNGKKRKITRRDFEAAMGRFEIDQKAFDNIFERFKKAIPKWHDFVEISFLPTKMKQAYQVMIDTKAKQIEL
jgi:serine/threonine-protein kinase HipA